MDNKNLYSLADALEKVKDAKQKGESSITLYGIHERCAKRVAELLEADLEDLKLFFNNVTRQPSATFSFKATVR